MERAERCFTEKIYRDANIDGAKFGPQFYEARCDEDVPNPYDPAVWQEIGVGTIHSINGIEQGSTKRCRFFVRK